MKKELELALVKKYPNLYKDYEGDMALTCMHWGFECGDGWYNLIDELSAKLEPLGVVAAQVKEKFGGLRFYYRDGPSPRKLDRVLSVIARFFFTRFFFKCGLWVIFNKVATFRRKFYKTLDEEVFDMVRQAEHKSYETCEVCGKPGKTRGRGWIRTLCDQCEAKKD